MNILEKTKFANLKSDRDDNDLIDVDKVALDKSSEEQVSDHEEFLCDNEDLQLITGSITGTDIF